jgi:hypothetical protein
MIDLFFFVVGVIGSFLLGHYAGYRQTTNYWIVRIAQGDIPKENFDLYTIGNTSIGK